MENLYNKTIGLMKKYNIYANKNLGQNFLISEDIVEQIVERAEISEEDLVIEIGPGLGTLTKKLLEKAGKVICIELDNKMLKVLQDRFGSDSNFEIINMDVLKVDMANLIKNNLPKKAKVVANLPYYITTPIIMKLLEERLDLESITVMVQKEVADRLVAKPGDAFTGAITYAISYYTYPQKVLDVPNSSFIPEPEVESSVINLKVLKKPSVDVKSEEMFFKVIKLAFMQKRKTLLNSLSNGKLLESKKEVEEMLIKLEISPQIRAEKLNLEDFARIADYFSPCLF